MITYVFDLYSHFYLKRIPKVNDTSGHYFEFGTRLMPLVPATLPVPVALLGGAGGAHCAALVCGVVVQRPN